MIAHHPKKEFISNNSNNIWVITKGQYVNEDLKGICGSTKILNVIEYRISDLGKHLLNPNPVQISKQLIGCEIQYFQSFLKELSNKIRRILPAKLTGFSNEEENPSDVFMSQQCRNDAFLKDEGLKIHIRKLKELLKQYDPIYSKLRSIDKNKISDVVGICKDLPDKDLKLNLQGSVSNKIRYILEYLGKDVGVILEKQNISDGLLDLKGFNFESYNPQNSYRLIRLFQNSKTRYCVLDMNNFPEFWVQNIYLVKHLHFLEQSIQANMNLKNSLNQCVTGLAKPLNFFCKQLEIHYSENRVPSAYKEIFESHHLDGNKKDAVISALNTHQFGVTFSYLLQKGTTNDKLYTDTSVLHNVKALEPIKNHLPEIYSEVGNKATATEAGKFYLLDALQG